MSSTGRETSARALMFVFAALTAFLVVAPQAARAGTYTVSACEAAPDGHTNNSWWQGNSGVGYYTVTGCPNDPNGNRQGMLAMAGLNASIGNLGFFSAGWTRFDAPSGTTIAGLRLTYDGTSQYPNAGWSSFIASSDDGFQGSIATGNPHFGYLDGCTAYAFCSSYSGGARYWSLMAGTTSVSATIQCEAGGGCPTGSDGAYVALHAAQVTLEDDAQPTLTNGRGLWLHNSDWVRGTQYVGFDASDASGIRLAAIELDPGTAQAISAVADTRSCDYTFAVPCPQQGIETNFDTTRLTDGSHTLRLVAQDAAGNWKLEDSTIYVDNHSPARPSMSVDPVSQPGGWARSPLWTARWTNDTSGSSGIVTAHWRVCPADGSSPCWTTDTRVGDPNFGVVNSATGDFGITRPGDYVAKMYLEDEAGNTDPNTASDPVHLKFDNVVPGDAQPAHANGWLNAQEAASYAEPISLVPNARPPVSGIAGYAVSLDGSEPGTTMNVSANGNLATYLISNLAEGHNTIKARAISGAGLASANVQSVDLPVDKTPPSVDARDAPDPGAWQNHDVALTFSGIDQPTLSGMAASDPAQPATAGAYMSYSIDGASEQQVRGDAAVATVASDGVHHVTYQAHDLAGNPSTQHSVDLRIDKTAPELVTFEDQDPNTPGRISVVASDRTSGLADGGAIQLRPAGSTNVWTSLPTSRSGDHYIADISPSAAPEKGLYELRAVVPDQAGNRAAGTTNRRGATAQVFVDPAKLREPNGVGGSSGGSGPGVHCFGCPGYPTATVPTRISARLVKPTARKRAPKCTKQRSRKRRCAAHKASARKRRSKKPRQPGSSREQLTGSLLVPFGKGAVAKGTLDYSDGQPIPGVSVDVYARLDAAGSSWSHVAAVRTDTGGRFSYRAPGGPSRTLGFRYDGTDRDKPAQATGMIKVPASTTIAASKRRLHVGQTLTLRGQLRPLGAPLPAAGKLVVLEAFDRRRWRKFATVRSGKQGTWRYRYRFVATRGIVTYPMRAVVERDSSYPFETGASRSVRVTVRGR